MTRNSKPGNLILVVEDDAALRDLIREELEDAGFVVIAAGDAESAVRLMAQRAPELIVSDVRLPGDSGLMLLERSRSMAVPPAFIVITAFGTVEQAVDALKRGADDFLTKPLNLDHLLLTVQRALERRALHGEIARYREMLRADDFHGLIGRSAPMRQLFEQVRRAARASGPVLITGESGVGKELVARALHGESGRSEGPFVAVNCAGIPADLLESELFGHSAGAFTGAQRARKGLFEEAGGGTMLLDEIGEMPAAMQSKLLRILQDGSMRPVGENRERQVDVRIVAATNRELEADIEDGLFRADLFYRLETFSLHVPPLRLRGEDIELLAAHFVARFGASSGRRVERLSAGALARLRAYPFPGNVRELSNAIERAAAFASEVEIKIEDLPERIRCFREPPAQHDAVEAAHALIVGDDMPPLRDIEYRYVRFVLDRVGGNKRRAADLLGIGRRTLYRYLDKADGADA